MPALGLGLAPGFINSLINTFDVVDDLLALMPTSLYLAGLSPVWQATGGTGAVSAENDPIGRLDDLSTNARNLTRLTADANRPLWLPTGGPNGLGAWDINGGKGWLNAAHPSPASGAIVVLVKFDSTAAFAVVASRMESQAWADGFGLLIADSGEVRAYQNNYGTDFIDAAVSADTWYVVSVLALGDSGAGSVRVRVNGVEVGASAGAGSTLTYNNGNFFVGSDGSDNLDGKISAVLTLDPDSVPAAEAILMQWADL